MSLECTDGYLEVDTMIDYINDNAIPGADGADGAPGEQGETGTPGAPGEPGAPGVTVDYTYQKEIIHELDNTFPNYDEVKALYDQDRYWTQALYIYEDRLYIMYSGIPVNSVTSRYIVVYNFITGAFIYGFNMDNASMGEGIVVRRRGANLILHNYREGHSIGEWDITIDPANTSTLAPTVITDIRMRGFLAYDAARDKLIVQSYPYDDNGQRNEFRIVDPDTYAIEDYFTLDRDYVGMLGDTYEMSYKVQGICVHNDKFVLVHGTAYNGTTDLDHKNKIGGVTYLNDIGKYQSGERYNPQKFKDVLTAEGIFHETMEFEGVCSYQGDVYTLMITNWCNSGLDGGLFIFKEHSEGIDFSSAGTIFGGTDSNMLPDNSKPYLPDGVRNPFYPLDETLRFNSFEVVLNYMKDTALKELTLYPYGTDLIDINGDGVGTSKLVHFKTVNLYSFSVVIDSASTTRHLWCSVNSGEPTGWLQREHEYLSTEGGELTGELTIGTPATNTGTLNLIGLNASNSEIFWKREDGTNKSSIYTKDGSALNIANYNSLGATTGSFWFNEDGNLTVSSTAPASDNHLTRKDYVDGKLSGGASGSFTSQDGKTVTVTNGIITEIV